MHMSRVVSSQTIKYFFHSYMNLMNSFIIHHTWNNNIIMLRHRLNHGIRFLSTGSECLSKTIALCPGQGNISQSLFQLPMLHRSPRVVQALELASEILPHIPITRYFSPRTYPNSEESNELLSRTSFVQPLVLLATYLNYEVVKDVTGWDVNSSDYIIGHSLGELSALVVQGVISLEDGLKISARRGELMEQVVARHSQNGEEWGMTAFLFRDKDFKSILKVVQDDLKINVANINGYSQIVVSGEFEDLKTKVNKLNVIQKQLTQLRQWHSRIAKVRLQTRIPAHHPMLREIEEELRQLIHTDGDLVVPVICNLNGYEVAKNAERVVDNFVKVTSRTVQFADCLNTATKDENYENFIFKNVSDVTYGLVGKFFKGNHHVENHDLLAEVSDKLKLD